MSLEYKQYNLPTPPQEEVGSELKQTENTLVEKAEVSMTKEAVLGLIKSSLTNLDTNSRVQRGEIQSGGFQTGVTGWKIDAQGNVEFNNGTFRGTLTAGQIDIPDAVTANSFHVNTGGDAWWGATIIGSATAKVLSTGVATFTSVTATGTINATGGYIGTTTALVFESQGINTGTTGWIRGGMTDYNSGTGYFLGYNSSNYKFSIGNSSDAGNLLLWDGSDLIVNGSTILNQDIYGDGSDGDVTISGNTSLTADMYYNDLTVDNTFTLDMAGYRVFVAGTLTNNGSIIRNGNTGNNGSTGGNGTANSSGGVTASVAGASALSDGYLSGGIEGSASGSGEPGGKGAGGTAGNTFTSPTVGSAQTVALCGNGASGGTAGAGGDGSNSNGGAAGGGAAGGTATASTTKPRVATLALLMLEFTTPATPVKYTSGAGAGGSGGGGGGGGDNTGAGGYGGSGGSGGSSGSGGGVALISARIIINTGTISANGGVGGSGGSGGNGATVSDPPGGTPNTGGGGGGGAGSGGTGGYLVLIYNSLTDTGTITAAGGTAGTPGTGGSGNGTGTNGSNGATGNAGTDGVLLHLQV